MAYIGKPPNTAIVNQATSQSFSGNGSTTAFTLTRSVNVGEDLEVFVENVQQEPGSGKSYTASGTTLTFDAAPPSGTNNIYVIYRGEATINPRLEHDANAALAATTGTFSGAVTFSGGVSGDVAFDTNTLKVDSTNNRVGIGTTGPTHSLHVIGDVQAENSSGHRALIVKGSSTTNYEGGSLLLANAGMDTNYGGTYLYHHKAGGSGTQNAAFNISQRTAGGAYVSNIWNVDYQNSVQSFYVPNGGISGAVALGIDASGRVTMPYQPAFKVAWETRNATGSARDLSTNAGDSVRTGRDSYDIGNHFDAATGRFTAPVSGTYLFTFQFMRNGTNGSQVEARLRKNGGNNSMWARAYQASYQSAHEYGTITTTTRLNVNDYVSVRLGSGISIYNDDTYFTGVLIG